MIYEYYRKQILSVASQKGIIATEQCSIENQKGVIAV